jgi:hypothetical protein
MDGFPDRSCTRPTDASIGKGKGKYYNLRIILPILSISDPYLRTIEPSLLIISLATGIADCRWRHGRRHMKVKLCARCPYKPRDLASHYDPEAAPHVCAKCDGEQGMPTNHYPREVYRRTKCATVPNIFGRAQRSAAPSVTASLVSSATTRGELPSVQRNALIASRTARRATADGYAGCKPPDNSCGENHAEISRCSDFRNTEAAQ